MADSDIGAQCLRTVYMGGILSASKRVSDE